MKTLLAALLLALTTGSVALAFDTDTQAVLDRHKSGKPVNVADLTQFMQASAQWCYLEQDHSCAWTDIYLDVTEAGATFEIGNAWDDDTDIAFTDEASFKDNRYVCETGKDWVPTMRATRRSDGGVIAGRDLWALKTSVETSRSGESLDCFDYLYLRSDAEQQTVTLLQRQYTDEVHRDGKDVEVTLHLDAEDAARLVWR